MFAGIDSSSGATARSYVWFAVAALMQINWRPRRKPISAAVPRSKVIERGARCGAGAVTLFECGQVRPSRRFSARPCTHGFPRGYCLASMGSNLCCGAVGLGWDEEVSDGGEDRHEMLQ